jgi:penicillin amidase
MPLAQISNHGPVVRMVVAPGNEASGFLSMPGGQSGHPLAPYYGRGHAEWLAGAPAPLLPGVTAYVLLLTPTFGNN